MSAFAFDESYIQKLAANDQPVVDHFTAYFGTLLRIKLRTKLRSHQMIEDIRQDTFLRVLSSIRKRDGLHNPERLGGFVNSVCNNVMMEHFRASTRLQQMPEDAPEVVDEEADPTRNLVSEERKRLVEQVLDSMPAKDRELLRMVYLEERSKEFICKELNVKPEYYRVLIHRAKSRFREVLGNFGPNGSPKS